MHQNANVLTAERTDLFPAADVFSKFFCLLPFEGHLHHFSKIKSHKEVTKSRNQCFSLHFLLDDRRIRIRIFD
jgi:hypothetical protein